MRRMIVSAACFCALLGPAAAQSAGHGVRAPYNSLALPAPASVTGITAATPVAAHNCHKAWRCGPYACGWRQICGHVDWRPFWHARHNAWRRHQWRRHYW